jgi:hypothetical protein
MLFLTLAAASAPASAVTADAKLPEGAKAVDARFEADETRGTAWVAVRWVRDEPVGEGPTVDETLVSVPGLAYDAAAHAIRLEDAGGARLVATRRHILFAKTWRAEPGVKVTLAEAMTSARVVVEAGEASKLAKN